MLENNDAITQLTTLLSNYDWFAGKVVENPKLHNSIIAYVHYMNGEVLRTVPDSIDGVDVRIHFISSCPTEPNNFFTVVSQSTLPLYVPTAKKEPEEPVFDLHNEIWNLTRVCGRDNLIDIMYEVMDGDDAVTNLGAEYPEVYNAMLAIAAKVSYEDLLEELDV